MQKFSLQAMARELLERARGGTGGRAAATVIGDMKECFARRSSP